MAKKTPTTIWDKNGKSTQGYIDSGKTYYSDGRRISDGSRVIDDSGREWVMQGGKGVATGSNYAASGNPNSSYSTGSYTSGNNNYGGGVEDALRKQYEQQQRALQEQVSGAVSQNEAYIPKVNQSFEDSVRSAYVTRELAKSQAPEAMSAMGASGGMSESALIGLNSQFENTRNEQSRIKQAAIDQIMQNSANIRSSGDISLANLGADYSGRLAQAMQEQIVRQQEQANWQKQYDMQNQQWDFSKGQYQDQLKQQQWENDLAEKQYKASLAKARSGGGGTAKGTNYGQEESSGQQQQNDLSGNGGSKYQEKYSILRYSQARDAVLSMGAVGKAERIRAVQSQVQRGQISEVQGLQLLSEFGLV